MSKTTNYSNNRARQVIWGLSAAQWAGSELPPPIEYENSYGSALAEGDVVAIQGDGTVAPIAVVGYAGPVGIVLDDIDAGDTGPVAFSGPVDLVNVVAAVTAGDYGETSATLKAAQDTGSASPNLGSFVLFTSSGTTPSGYLVGASGGGSVNQGGDMVPYYIPTGETFTVPLYRQGLYSHSVTVDGALVIDGVLEFVS